MTTTTTTTTTTTNTSTTTTTNATTTTTTTTTTATTTTTTAQMANVLFTASRRETAVQGVVSLAGMLPADVSRMHCLGEKVCVHACNSWKRVKVGKYMYSCRRTQAGVDARSVAVKVGHLLASKNTL